MLINRHTRQTTFLSVLKWLPLSVMLIFTMLVFVPTARCSEQDFGPHDEMDKFGFVETQYGLARPSSCTTEAQERAMAQEAVQSSQFAGAMRNAPQNTLNPTNFMRPAAESFSQLPMNRSAARRPVDPPPTFYGGRILPPTTTGSVNLTVAERFSISDWTYECAKYQHRLGEYVKPYVENQDPSGFTAVVNGGALPPPRTSATMKIILNNDPTTGKPPVY